jgi:hypothetical protein
MPRNVRVSIIGHTEVDIELSAADDKKAIWVEVDSHSAKVSVEELHEAIDYVIGEGVDGRT